MALTSRTVAPRGDYAQRVERNHTKGGDTLAWTGSDGATEDLVIDELVSKINLTGDAGASVNDFDVPAGAEHGQEVLFTASSIPGGNLTLTEDAGVTILGQDASAVTTITFDADAEYALLRWELDHWRIVATNATVA